MLVRLKAVYKNGTFVPLSNADSLNVPENAEVELTVHNPYIVPATAKSEEERELAKRYLLETWEQHPLAPDAPRLTRGDLHERR